MSLTHISLVVSILFASTAVAAGQERHFVGEVFIVGNTSTPAHLFRARVDLYPGQVLSYPEVRIAERDLARLDWFVVDPKNGIRPTVQILECDGIVKDILIKVHERPGNWARLAAWNVVLARSSMDVFRLVEAADLLQIGLEEWRKTR